MYSIPRPSCVCVLSLQESTMVMNVCVCVWCRRACACRGSNCGSDGGQPGTVDYTDAWLHRVSISLSVGSDLLFGSSAAH